MAVTISGFDHLVLTVADIDATCAFYRDLLGMEVVTFGAGRVALRFGEHKINLHPIENDIEFKARTPTPGSTDLCLRTETPVAELRRHLEAHGVEVLTGPVERDGAKGPILSVYFRDPDGNLIEVSNLIKR